MLSKYISMTTQSKMEDHTRKVKKKLIKEERVMKNQHFSYLRRLITLTDII